tara:strand:- start:5441 stop:5926 length:486 start_codon:yes stop_codon:yes gene_type:complete
MFTKDQFLQIITSETAYKQNMIYAIDADGKEQRMKNYKDVLANKEKNSIKIERMEAYNSDIFTHCLELENKHEHVGPITCHLFYAKENAHSFKEHIDPDDVIIHCCEGHKTINVNRVPFTIGPKAELHIPANTPHQAFNESEALTLSFGLEGFIEDKILVE